MPDYWITVSVELDVPIPRAYGVESILGYFQSFAVRAANEIEAVAAVERLITDGRPNHPETECTKVALEGLDPLVRSAAKPDREGAWYWTGKAYY